MAPLDDRVEPANQVRALERELERYGEALTKKERWLVLNKRDRLDADEFQARRAQILESLGWRGPVYGISALTGEGTAELAEDLMRRLEALRSSLGGDEMTTEEANGDDWHPLG
jgi:GTP-binding protein